MTRQSFTVDRTDPPPEDWHHSITRVLVEGHLRPSTTEQRARDAEERANKAQQRAVEADKRAEASERRIEALVRALDSRGPIEQAKGVLMGVFDLDPDAAFDTLVIVSQHANVKLNVVAERFLADLAGIDVGEAPRHELTYLLASMSRPDGQHFT